MRLLTTFVFALVLCAGAAPRTERPNVVLILTDDLGGTDLGCYGSSFYRTPNVDRLASQGMRFTQAYSACTVCSPTRASILTGQYPARLHITDWIPGHKRPFAKLSVPDWRMFLPTNEVNIARVLHGAGYRTASIGKWHLGPPECFPDKQGFDLNIGGCDRGQPPSYFSPYRIETLKDGPAGEFLTDRECAEAVKFIAEKSDKPFFLYLPNYAVHTPIQAKSNVVESYFSRVRKGYPQTNSAYAALVQSVDDSVGRIMSELDRLGLSENTIVIFTSDNGGLLPVTSNLGLRAGKGSAYEGGVRVPLIVRWPGKIKAGSSNSTPVMSIDFYPTFLELLGVQDSPGHVQDGKSLVPLLTAKRELRRDALFWHYPHYHPGGASPYGAIRDGDWKLIEFYETGRTELYQLANDPKEERDLAAGEPAVASRLLKRLREWRTEVGAQMPSQNPDYDPAQQNKPERRAAARRN